MYVYIRHAGVPVVVYIRFDVDVVNGNRIGFSKSLIDMLIDETSDFAMRSITLCILF